MVTVQVAGGSEMDGMTKEIASRDLIDRLCFATTVEPKERRIAIYSCEELLIPGNNRIFVKPVYIKDSQW